MIEDHFDSPEAFGLAAKTDSSEFTSIGHEVARLSDDEYQRLRGRLVG